MTREEILHLAELSRIELTEGEIEKFAKEFGDILTYVAGIKNLAGSEPTEKTVGILHNVFREDAEPNAPGIYTEDLVNAAPQSDRGYVKVKKILGA